MLLGGGVTITDVGWGTYGGGKGPLAAVPEFVPLIWLEIELASGNPFLFGVLLLRVSINWS